MVKFHDSAFKRQSRDHPVRAINGILQLVEKNQESFLKGEKLDG